METRSCLGLPWWRAAGAKASLQLGRPCRGLMTVPRKVMDMKELGNHILRETALGLGPWGGGGMRAQVCSSKGWEHRGQAVTW